jgi:hypothetical protein
LVSIVVKVLKGIGVVVLIAGALVFPPVGYIVDRVLDREVRESRKARKRAMMAQRAKGGAG